MHEQDPNDERQRPPDAPLPYGGRFFDELRRLTNSTWGFKYGQIERVRAMSRAELVALLAELPGADWIVTLDSSSPEEFARAIIQEGRRRAESTGWSVPDPADAILDLADFLAQ